jgi:hypothetical protein
MNLQDPADFARRTAAAKKPVDVAKPAIATPDAAEPDGAESDPKDMMTIKIGKKPEGGYTRSVDNGDGFPPDDTEHETLSDAAQLDEQLEAKFGESAVDDAEEEIAPGIHEKVAAKLEGSDKGGDKSSALPKGGFLGKFGGGE